MLAGDTRAIWARNGLVVAGIRRLGWIRYVSGVDDAGNAIDVRDPAWR